MCGASLQSICIHVQSSTDCLFGNADLPMCGPPHMRNSPYIRHTYIRVRPNPKKFLRKKVITMFNTILLAFLPELGNFGLSNYRIGYLLRREELHGCYRPEVFSQPERLSSRRLHPSRWQARLMPDNSCLRSQRSDHFLLVCFVRYPTLMRVHFVLSKAKPIEKGLL